MSLAPTLQLRTGQSLVMTPQLQQAIHLLTLSNLELEAVVADAVAANPLLDHGSDEGGREEGAATADAEPEPPLDLDAAHEARAGEEGDRPAGPRLDGGGSDGGSGEAFDFDRLAGEGPTLADHLLTQAGLALSGPALAIAADLIAQIDPAGYLTAGTSEVAERLRVPLAEVERVLATVQTFDPTGVGARDLAECLAIQAREADRHDPCMARLIANLPLVARGALPQLRRLCDVDDEDLADMIAELRGYDPKPGLAFGGEAAVAIEPDLFVTPTAVGWAVELNTATLPRAIVDRAYYVEVRAGATEADRAWLDERLADARWLVRALDQRRRTILKVAAELVEQQAGFFRHGVSALRPLTLAAVADKVGVHETTVSRVTKGKHLACPRGTFELKWFFTSGVAAGDGGEASAAAVKADIAKLVAAETADAVLSDDQLMAALKERGYDLARRTVAKYREAEGIGSSVARRRRFKLGG